MTEKNSALQLALQLKSKPPKAEIGIQNGSKALR